MNNRQRTKIKLKSKSVIPKGIYCYDEHYCPYWSLKKHLPEQENGYCSYLGKSDWDINEECDRKHGGWTIGYSVDKTLVGNKISAHDCLGSLLWDMCKECKVNEEVD